jgi:integrase
VLGTVEHVVGVRSPEHYTTAGGDDRWKVRYRSAGAESSQTFRREPDAKTFAALLGSAPGQAGVTEALAWLASREKADDAQTFGQWFDTYLKQLTGIQPRTRDDYKAMHRRYLTHLDPVPLSLLTRAHVASTVNKLEADGLSPKTIKNVIHMLSSVLGLAVDEGHLTRNPCKRVRLPKTQLGEHEERYLTHEEAAALLDATDAHYQPLVAFLLGTGLRWSEATALQARHVDLKGGTVRVQRAWKRVPGGWEIGPPKSTAANRTVNAGVVALVAVAPLLGKPSDLVFTTPRGNVVRHSNFYNRIWLPACARAGLDPRPTIHDTRHTHASWLLSDGVGIEAVQDQLGHESAETTRKVYAKLMPAVGVAVGRSASAAMERVLAQRSNLAPLALVRPTDGTDDAAQA